MKIQYAEGLEAEIIILRWTKNIEKDRFDVGYNLFRINMITEEVIVKEPGKIAHIPLEGLTDADINTDRAYAVIRDKEDLNEVTQQTILI